MAAGSDISSCLKETDQNSRGMEDGGKEDYQALVQQLLEYTAAQADILERLAAR